MECFDFMCLYVGWKVGCYFSMSFYVIDPNDDYGSLLQSSSQECHEFNFNSKIISGKF